MTGPLASIKSSPHPNSSHSTPMATLAKVAAAPALITQLISTYCRVKAQRKAFLAHLRSFLIVTISRKDKLGSLIKPLLKTLYVNYDHQLRRYRGIINYAKKCE
jgi:hypothetical protein